MYFVRLRHGAADLPLFSQQVSRLGAEVSGQDEQIAAVESSIHPQAMGWWILALLAGIVGLAVVAQALMRQSLAEAEDFPLLGALGIHRRQLVMLGVARSLLVGLIGAVGGVVIAFFLSPLAPLGEGACRRDHDRVSFRHDRAAARFPSCTALYPRVGRLHRLPGGSERKPPRPCEGAVSLEHCYPTRPFGGSPSRADRGA